MRIGIDARLYGERGLGRYISELLLHLEDVDADNEYVVVLRKGNTNVFTPRDTSRLRVIKARSRWYSVAEQWEIPHLFQREQCDVVHIPHMNVPLWLRQPFIATIHDLILLDFPDSRGSRLPKAVFDFKFQIYKRIIQHAIRDAAHVLTPSQYIKDRVCDEFGKNPHDVTVTYEGVSKSLGDNWNHRAMNERLPYFLYVGSAYPHKNLEAVIDAFRIVRNEHSGIQLVIVSKKDFFMQRLEKENGGGDGVVYAGEVSDEELSSLYQNAVGLLLASCEEGFGLPGLEALRFGTPAIFGDRASLPEVYGNSAIYVNPYDCEDIQRAMREVLSLKHGSTKALKHTTTWEEMTRKTVEVYTGIPRLRSG